MHLGTIYSGNEVTISGSAGECSHNQKDDKFYKSTTMTEKNKLIKVYVLSENIITHDGKVLIVDGNNLLLVKTLHQDTSGVYYYTASIYGKCPYGHPYSRDGGCLGYNCPFN